MNRGEGSPLTHALSLTDFICPWGIPRGSYVGDGNSRCVINRMVVAAESNAPARFQMSALFSTILSVVVTIFNRVTGLGFSNNEFIFAVIIVFALIIVGNWVLRLAFGSTVSYDEPKQIFRSERKTFTNGGWNSKGRKGY